MVLIVPDFAFNNGRVINEIETLVGMLNLSSNDEKSIDELISRVYCRIDQTVNRVKIHSKLLLMVFAFQQTGNN